ncbi:ornithine carbamoyltransferase [Desulfatibacillum alkenivorans DSM 16219]|jgi:ornithine carbamoyltransferase|uniref:Ornithine carbamoyltransferase n=1 Tax=Desulfatibacillum alkenivorans DSM 16219 TaxID=1121393 RepID=A0A1M6T4G4_9BACT|nr:ornithine carbamoyltransferase [Desulfatibacillum alkenivorans]SHK51841.1 ornithine carbamoyltransferase [Desulfatibacillum alkenivorans DSM 16219]
MKVDITTLSDLSKEQIDELFANAREGKKKHKQGVYEPVLQGKTAGLVFDKPSTRTRVSFEAAMIQLGGVPMYIQSGDTQIKRQEPVEDTARVLSRYLDALVVRTFSQEFVEDLAREASIPIINALTDMYHPCQVLSDLLTVIELKGGYEGVKIVWIGDGNNVAHSWISAAAILGLDLVLACPDDHQPEQTVLDKVKNSSAGSVKVVSDPREAAVGADVLYTDVWASMGQEEESDERMKSFEGYVVDQTLVNLAAKDVSVMHCLPAHRGEEITAGVLEGPNSVVWDQAENKLHMHKAILDALIRLWK